MGYNECVQLLIEHGASMEVLMGPTKMTALSLAAQVRHYLLSHMWLGGCPNPSKMEQCWECTFLNLYAHVKTK